MIRQQSTFSRTMDNMVKMGAYFTDIEHCLDIGKQLKFPETEVSVLEPSIGDGSAVLAVTGKSETTHENVKIFGVELNEISAKECQENPLLEEVLEADFLEGVRIKNNVFSLVFGNPPYMEDDLDEVTGRERVERQFLEKVTQSYLQKEGILVWVIPHSSFVELGSMRFIMNHYEILRVYKFREEEFKKYHQIVLIARKCDTKNYLRDAVEEKLKEYELEKIPLLPTECEEENRIEVPPSDSAKVNIFCTKEFDTQGAFKRLHTVTTEEAFSDVWAYADKHLTPPKFVTSNLGKPPIPLKKDSLYLLATSGSGQGYTGSIETGDLHLQRGVAEVIEESEVVCDSNGKASEEKVTTRTKVTMTVIENSGKVTVLE